MKKIQGVLLIALTLLFSSGLRAQDVGSQLKQLGADNASAFIGPLMAGWGAGLNSGFFHSADLHGVLGFDIQVKATFTSLGDDDKTYKFKTPATIGPFVQGTDYPAEIVANTIVGKKDKTPLNVGGTPILYVPGGLDIPATALVMPQVTIGLPFGLEVMWRFLPTTKMGDAGKVNFIGFGLRHDIDQYIPLLPLDLAVHFMTQKFKYEDANGDKLISASGTAFGIEASKGLLFLTVYGGIQIESSSWDIGPFNYTLTPEVGPALTGTVNQFTIKGKNKSRVLVGVRLLLGFVNVHADYSVATSPVLTLGAGITFR